MRIRINPPFIDAQWLQAQMNQRFDELRYRTGDQRQLPSNAPTQPFASLFGRALCEVLVEVLQQVVKSIEVEVETDPNELDKLDVQVMERVAVELMTRVAQKK